MISTVDLCESENYSEIFRDYPVQLAEPRWVMVAESILMVTQQTSTFKERIQLLGYNGFKGLRILKSVVEWQLLG